MQSEQKWPKIFPVLTPEQVKISNDFMQYWHEVLANSKQFRLIEQFNHRYPKKHSSNHYLTTLEIGAGLGEHLIYEELTPKQEENYVALELRENMAEKIHARFPRVNVCVADCQAVLPHSNDYFDRILAIHILEHLPNLPAAVKELYRVCNKQGQLHVVIPCEGGVLYSLARKISAERLFEKRYGQSYQWFIEREHVNKPVEIIEELTRYFSIKHKQYFPFLIPSTHCNLCIGLTLQPKNGVSFSE